MKIDLCLISTRNNKKERDACVENGVVSRLRTWAAGHQSTDKVLNSRWKYVLGYYFHSPGKETNKHQQTHTSMYANINHSVWTRQIKSLQTLIESFVLFFLSQWTPELHQEIGYLMLKNRRMTNRSSLYILNNIYTQLWRNMDMVIYLLQMVSHYQHCSKPFGPCAELNSLVQTRLA